MRCTVAERGLKIEMKLTSAKLLDFCRAVRYSANGCKTLVLVTPSFIGVPLVSVLHTL